LYRMRHIVYGSLGNRHIDAPWNRLFREFVAVLVGYFSRVVLRQPALKQLHTLLLALPRAMNSVRTDVEFLVALFAGHGAPRIVTWSVHFHLADLHCYRIKSVESLFVRFSCQSDSPLLDTQSFHSKLG